MRHLLFVALVPSVALAQPEPPPPDVAPTMQVTYDKGLKFEQSDEKFGLKIQFRNQLRFESTRPTEDNSQFASHFLIPRSRLTVDGHVFGKGTRYKLEVGLGDTGSFSFVRDLYVDQKIGSPVWFRAGVWKRPFNRQELVSDFASEFNERAITATFVGGGRDLGVAVHNDYEKSPEGIEWVLGVFNSFSGGEDRPDIGGCTTNMMGTTACPPPTNFPADFGPAVVARAGWNVGDVKGYAEGDLEYGPLRYAVGASYKIDLANTISDRFSHGLQVDAMLKVQGLGVEVGAYMMKIQSADAGYGAFGQIGYFVVPKRLQLAARAAIAPDPKDADRNQVEARLAVNLFWQGHAWKWANDVGVLTTTGEDPMTMTTDKPDLVIRSMLQLTL